MKKFDDIYDVFKDKITDYDLLDISGDILDEILFSLMKKACFKFNRICKIDLNDRNDDMKEFNNELDDSSVDIITEWMLEGWLKQYRNDSEKLKNKMSTKDFSMFSPANLLDKVNMVYENTRKQARSMMNEYSYVNSDISKLKS